MGAPEFHTAGPYEYRAIRHEDGDVIAYQITAINGGHYVADAHCLTARPDEAEPTARIISAAPSMLAALRVAQDYLRPRAISNPAASSVLRVVEGAIVEATTAARRADVED